MEFSYSGLRYSKYSPHNMKDSYLVHCVQQIFTQIYLSKTFKKTTNYTLDQLQITQNLFTYKYDIIDLHKHAIGHQEE